MFEFPHYYEKLPVESTLPEAYIYISKVQKEVLCATGAKRSFTG